MAEWEGGMDEDLESMLLADKFTLTFLFLSNHCSGICSCNHISCMSLFRPPISKIAKSELAAVLRKKRRSTLSASTRAEWPVPAYSVPDVAARKTSTVSAAAVR